MGLLDRFINRIVGGIADAIEQKRLTRIDTIRDYYVGDQRLPLKVKAGQPDYNTIANVIKVIVDRSISMLFGYGIEFDFPGEGETPESDYLNEVWDLNKQEILLHNVAKNGAETGTCAIQINPDGIYSSKLSKPIPRLVVIDTALLKIRTLPNDVAQHTKYIYEYVYTKENGKEGAHKQEVTRLVAPIEADNSFFPEMTWEVVDYEQGENNKWIEISRVTWPYYFAPYVVWQNLPEMRTPTGIPDITVDTLRGQDQLNFVLSDIVKTNALFAHPKVVAKNVNELKDASASPDQIIKITGDEKTDMYTLEMQSEMVGSNALFKLLKNELFESSHTANMDTLSGVGDITNFRVKLAFQDALQKLNIKRELYGDALINLNKYLLILADDFGDDPDPGVIVWGNPLPENETEEVNALRNDRSMEIVSKQTVSERRGYVWEEEKKRIDAEREAEGNIGESLLAGFERGQ